MHLKTSSELGQVSVTLLVHGHQKLLSMNRELTALVFCSALTACATPTPDAVSNGWHGQNRQIDETSFKDTEQRYLERTLAQPESARPWFELGNFYVDNNRLAAAEYAYREAIKREKTPKALHNLGLVQIRLGLSALSEASKHFPAEDPVHTETHQVLKLLLEEEGL